MFTTLTVQITRNADCLTRDIGVTVPESCSANITCGAFRLLQLDNLGLLASSGTQETVAAGSADPQITAENACQPRQKTTAKPLALDGPATQGEQCFSV